MNKLPHSILGKTIGIIGSPGSGKSFLASKFLDFENTEVIFEDQTKFPEFIINSLNSKSHLFETILWFRNKQVNDWITAKKSINENKIIVLDTTFYQYQIYVDHYIKDKYFRDILSNLGEIDNIIFSPPDIIIHISTTTKLVNDYLKDRQLTLPVYSQNLIKFLTSMATFSQNFINNNRSLFKYFIEINRRDYDFKDQIHFNRLIEKILKEIGNS